MGTASSAQKDKTTGGLPKKGSVPWLTSPVSPVLKLGTHRKRSEAVRWLCRRELLDVSTGIDHSLRWATVGLPSTVQDANGRLRKKWLGAAVHGQLRGTASRTVSNIAGTQPHVNLDVCLARPRVQAPDISLTGHPCLAPCSRLARPKRARVRARPSARRRAESRRLSPKERDSRSCGGQCWRCASGARGAM